MLTFLLANGGRKGLGSRLLCLFESFYKCVASQHELDAPDHVIPYDRS